MLILSTFFTLEATRVCCISVWLDKGEIQEGDENRHRKILESVVSNAGYDRGGQQTSDVIKSEI